MATVEKPISLTAIFDEVGQFFGSAPTMQQITEFHLSDEANQYLSDLLEANRTGGLLPEERETLDKYAVIEHLVQFIKLHAFSNLGIK